MIKVQEIRNKFVKFFEDRRHVLLPPSSLIPADPSVLFTSAGMQQFKPWFIDSALAKNKRVVTIQPCFRTSDIEEVGDATHLTYFEMLGHFSFGDPARHASAGVAGGYFKKEAIEWGYEFIVSELRVSELRVSATYFGGDDQIPADTESLNELKKYLPENKIEARGKADNFWGPTGSEGPCGPNVEFYVDGVEIWNAVFNEYLFKDGKYTKLSSPGVDMGGGLERIATVINNFKDVFETDELASLLVRIPDGDLRSRRIIVDHVRAISALIKDGVTPSNKAQGAVLRRLIRRSFTHGRLIGADDGLIVNLVEKDAQSVIQEEKEKFSQAMKAVMSVYSNTVEVFSSTTKVIPAQEAFLLYESYGLPLELLIELARKDGLSVDVSGTEKLMELHREKSRAGIEGKFKGGLVEVTPETTRLHTAHHLLLAALRKVLGDHIVQRGSNINSERLRIDVSHQDPLKPEEITQVEQFVNEWIGQDLKITRQEMPINEAYKKGALGEFGATYPEKVSVYKIGDVSLEICGGPHVSRTGETNGVFKITKQESSGAGIRRIKAILA